MDNEEEQQPLQEQVGEPVPAIEDASAQVVEGTIEPTQDAPQEAGESVAEQATPEGAPVPEPPLLAIEALLKAEFDALKARVSALESVAHSGHSIPGEAVGQIVETVMAELAARWRAASGMR